MKKLTLGDLANLAEIVGAIAIVISLIYVGQELRANTAAVKAASLQSITNSSSASMLAVVESSDFADIRLRGDQDPAQLSGADNLRYLLYQRQMWLHFQNVWTQWKLGVIDDGVWKGYRNVICDDMIATDKRLAWWNQVHANALSEDFVKLIRNCH
jgi:hypothetical protein